MLLNNIAIVGGGTAGLLTAIILRKTYPNLKIDIIESDNIGIVGVGEGSTEHWRNFISDCNIKLVDLVKETDCTFKYGINFANWLGDGTNYIHNVSSNMSIESQTHSKIMYAYPISEGLDAKSLVMDYVEKSLHIEPYWGVNQFHFNTFKLNTFLHKICEERSIGIVKADIDSVHLTEDGSIDHLRDKQGVIHNYEFYVDSTGFHRLLLHKTMGVPWRSYQKYLPMNSAIAFPTERQEDIPSWTLSRAMDSGWLWRIPTQERFGNGYVFNDSFMDFDKAKQEVEKLYGHEVSIAKQIKFDAGCLETSWIKNCCAIGLSCSFVEPLEASSIGSSIQQAYYLATALSSYIPGSTIDLAQRTFNRLSNELLENIVEFVQLHYITPRQDTSFWQSIQDLPKFPSLEEKLEIWQHKFPGIGEFQNRTVMFKESNYILVLHGLGLISKDIAKKEMLKQPKHVQETVPFNFNRMRNDMKNKIENGQAVSHRQALKWLADNPES
jgi:tryptophan halogenase